MIGREGTYAYHEIRLNWPRAVDNGWLSSEADRSLNVLFSVCVMMSPLQKGVLALLALIFFVKANSGTVP